jgi:glycosyltransferase involved in cell wall biosynthesis
VVVSDQVGLADQIIANDAGVVAPLRSKAFADGIDQMLSRPGPLDTDRDRIRAAFKPLFDWNTLADQWTAAYQSLITMAASASRPTRR